MNKFVVFLDDDNVLHAVCNTENKGYTSFQLFTNNYNLLKKPLAKSLDDVEAKFALVLSKILSFNYNFYQYYTAEYLSECIAKREFNQNIATYCRYSNYVLKHLLNFDDIEEDFLKNYYSLILSILKKD